MTPSGHSLTPARRPIEAERPSPAMGRRRGRKGFTLVEMLTVVSIIALLLGLAIPTVLQMRIQIVRNITMATISLLEGGCQAYAADFQAYPPSSDGNHGGFQGKHLLAMFLTGYGGDPNQDGAPGSNLASDDGEPGFGFRAGKRGRVYGPYCGAEKVQTTISGNHPVFVDASGNEIFYYRFDGSYNDAHNAGGPSGVDQYCRDGANNYFRTDFAIMSKGPDEKWESFREKPGTDDTTNLIRE